MTMNELDSKVLELIHEGMPGRKIAEKLGITIAKEKSAVRRLKYQGKL